eukprot:NODE_5521_length_937_cov_164.695332_g5299_i0.p1 GENE.NODE_5521_length_937_cov_164.695332_g5299_i0~~NODE_5521_length_937_cov_164.695332_g5299_i0.p1  ORF type:complete len:177 (+),score=13.88 NODE_5521_length_937_cov_164.695332_g5299_i0:279-809(+)
MEVHLDSGEVITTDGMLLATGYRFTSEFLRRPLPQLQETGPSGLYHMIFHPPNPTLSFVGIPQLIFPFQTFEMQARWVAAYYSGRVGLPSRKGMDAWIEQEAAARPKKEGGWLAMLELMGMHYTDDIAHFIGLNPPLWRNPSLARAALLGPNTPVFYNLGITPEAKEALLAASKAK